MSEQKPLTKILSERMADPCPIFQAAVIDKIPEKHWTKVDLAAVRFGWEAARLHGETEQLAALVRELREIVMHVTSLNMGKRHMVMIPGDDEPCFAQRKEWCDWMLGLAKQALAKSEGV
jgi:hypothetical protein